MCKQVKCETCQKQTWAGCGKHIDTALAGLQPDEKCKCKPSTQAEADAAGK